MNIRNLFIAAVAIFVCWHFYPKKVEDAGKKIAKVTSSAAKAGYETAKK